MSVGITRFLVPVLALSATSASLQAAPAPKPKLVVAIIVDQFRYDYLTRFRADYHGGFNQLLTEGAVFTNAHYDQIPTVTAVGHSIFMSGAMPAVSGIVGNTWYDRDEEKNVTSVCDWAEKTVGGHQEEKGPKCTDSDPASPRRLLVSTLGDEMRNADERAKVVGVSIKARGAILPSGHRALGAFWFDDVTGNFVSSSFYVNSLPAWAEAFNGQKLANEYTGRAWEGFPTWHFRAAPGSPTPYAAIPASPWGNELIERFAEEALGGEKLGQRGVTDLLTVSFSSNDYVGHRVGPDAPEVRDMAIRTDQLLANLFRRIDSSVGMKNVIVVLSADHGVARLPEIDKKDKMPGGYIAGNVENAVTAALNRRFGKKDWLIPGAGETALYFDHDALENAKTADGKSVAEDEVYDAAVNVLMNTPKLHVARVYTRKQLLQGATGDFVARAQTNGFNPRRSGDLQIIFEPGYIPGSSGTSHFSPYDYDRHVPLLFMGPGIEAGRYTENVEVNDVAPTLATILDVETPSGSSGRVLGEMLTK
ncbi:MAG: alkaline phosphatase family protein [Acidobacteriaceae bacterium]|nr:alkaline phosphatase family protein [Acidobacteriaceae bacterium]